MAGRVSRGPIQSCKSETRGLPTFPPPPRPLPPPPGPAPTRGAPGFEADPPLRPPFCVAGHRGIADGRQWLMWSPVREPEWWARARAWAWGRRDWGGAVMPPAPTGQWERQSSCTLTPDTCRERPPGQAGRGRSPCGNILVDFVDTSLLCLHFLYFQNCLRSGSKAKLYSSFVGSGEVSRAALLVRNLALGLPGGREAVRTSDFNRVAGGRPRVLRHFGIN